MTQPDPTPPAPAPAADTDAAKLQAEIDKWKALARKHEDQSKRTYAELEELKKAGDATKSDMDKVMAKLDAAEKRAQEADRRALHGEVVAATGLSMAKVARLKGETVEELMSDAEQVFDWKPKSDKDDDNGVEGGSDKGEGDDTTAYTRPKELLTAQPGVQDKNEVDVSKIADQILSRGF